MNAYSLSELTAMHFGKQWRDARTPTAKAEVHTEFMQWVRRYSLEAQATLINTYGRVRREQSS